MKTKRVPESIVNDIYDDLLTRIRHISIALIRERIPRITLNERYNITLTGTPTVGETEHAFFAWNCAILTAFRNVDGMDKEENKEWNINRNKELKRKLIDNSLMFRSVYGRYREAHWDEPEEEICFFVTNTDSKGHELASHEDIREFFIKVYRLAEYYEQDSFLFTFPGANRVAFLIATNDNAREEFRGDIKFAGPLFTHVQDIGAWTECSDGKISFRLNGMILIGGTGHKEIQLGQGNIFDIEGYNPDGIIIIHDSNQKELKILCKEYHGAVPLIKHAFRKKYLDAADVQSRLFQSMKMLSDLNCQCISIHCSASIDGSYLKGSKVVLDSIREWSRMNKHKLKKIILVDIYGEYDRVLAIEKTGY